MLKSFLDYKSYFDFLCDIFKDNLLEEPDIAIIEYKDSQDTVDHVILLSKNIRTHIYYLKDTKEYVFRSYYAFFEKIKSDETIEIIHSLVQKSLDEILEKQKYYDSYKTSLPISDVTIGGLFDFNDPNNVSYDIILEFKPQPDYIHITELAYKLLDLWKSFNKLSDYFRTELICNNSDLIKENKVITTEDNYQRLMK